MLTHGSLFTGIGGFDLGFERAGIQTLWQVEIDDYCRRVLEHHWPTVQRFTDVRTVGAHNLPRVDILSGGFPCQDISNAGKRAGIDGERSGLWSEYARIIRELRPRIVVVENVSALLVRGIERVLGDLAACGYDAEWQSIRASDVGAPHRRERIWIVAYPERSERRPHASTGNVADGHDAGREEEASGIGKRRQDVADAEREFSAARSELHEVRRPHEAARLDDGSSGSGANVAHTDGGRFAMQGESSGRGGFPARGGETLADADGSGRGKRRRPKPVRAEQHPAKRDGENVSDADGRRCEQRDARVGRVPIFNEGSRIERSEQWATEPDVGRVANGIPARVDRLKGLGNAIIPQIAEFIGQRIVSAYGKS